MFDHKSLYGNCLVYASWMFTSLSPSIIPIIFSTIASIMAIRYYYVATKAAKNKEKDKTPIAQLMT